MADRFVRSTGGNWNAAGTWESASGLKDTVTTPTAADDVYLDAQSGALTINATAACRSFDCNGYASTITHNAVSLTVGTTTARGDNIAMRLAGTYTAVSASATMTFNSSAGANLTIDLANKLVGNVTFSGGNHQLLNSFTYIAANTITHTAGVLDLNGYSTTSAIFTTSGSTARTLTLGSGTINLIYASNTASFNYTGSNLTISTNTGTVKYTGGNGSFAGNSVNYNGLTLYISGTAGTVTVTGGNTFANLIVLPTSTKSLNLTSGTTQTFTDSIHCYGSTGELTLQATSAGSAATVSKSTGNVNFYNTSIKDITFAGGATYNAYHNCTNVSGNANITFNSGIWYVDEESGNDAVVTPYGWWSVAYTGATGTIPAVGNTATGVTSSQTAKVNGFVNPHEWSLGSGTLYFIGVSGTFVAEQLDFTSGGHVDIAGNVVRCGWKSITSGALAARIAPGDTMHIAKSLDPTSLGLGTWTTRPYALPASFTPTSSTNASPIRITKTSHGFVTGDVAHVYGHTTNTAANGSWVVTRINDNEFDLIGSTGNGIGGATGTVYQINHMCVVLATACTQTINRCGEEGNWTAGSANYTPTQLAPGTDTRREGTYCIRVAAAAGAGAPEKAAYYTLPAELDLSSYQIINFWFNTSVALDSGDWSVCLCSDTLGAVPVNTFNIPAGPNSVNEWIPVTLDNGSALGSSIKSVAVYQNVDKGAFNFHIDNIFVSKATTAADCLTLNSVISKNGSATGGDEPFYPIMSVSQDGRVLMFKCLRNIAFGLSASYVGTTEQVTTYVRQMHHVAKTSTYNSTSQNTIQESGTVSNRISFLGGYDMSTDVQNGETYIYNIDGWGYGVWSSNKSYITISNLNPVNFFYGFVIDTGSYCEVGNIQTIAQAFADGMNLSGTNHTVNKVNGIVLCGYGLYVYSATSIEIQTINKVHSCWTATRGLIHFNAAINCSINNQIQVLANNAASASGLNFSAIADRNYIKGVDWIYGCDSCIWFDNSRFNIIDDLGLLTYSRANHGIGFNNYSWNNIIKHVDEISHHPSYGVYYGTNSYFNRIDNLLKNDYNVWAVVAVTDTNNGWDNQINNMVTTGNTNCLSIAWGGFRFRNCLFNETPLFGAALSSRVDTDIRFDKHQQTANNHKLYTYGGLISSDATTRHTASDISWSLAVTHTDRSLRFPIKMILATFAVNASTQVTFTAYCKKSHATDIGAKISCRAHQLTGITSYVEAIKANDTDWEQLSIQFTPTEAGVVEIEGQAWWIANTADETVWFDDITKSQA